MQVFRRLMELLDHQPHRTRAYGIGLDALHVCFVRIECNLDNPQGERRLYASAPLVLFNSDCTWGEHGQLLLRFLRLTPAALDFVDVELPVLLGVKMETVLCHRAGAILYRAAQTVYKVGERADHEHAMLERLMSCQPPVCPHVMGHAAGVVAMEAGTDVRVAVDLNLAALARDLYWAVYQLHEARIVHCDIKPANVVRMPDGQHCLVDFDRALDLKSGAIDRLVWTEGFNHLEDVIAEEEGPEDFDLESVFWTVVYLWALQQRQQPGRLRQRLDEWHSHRGEFAIKAYKHCPAARALVAQVDDVSLRLRHPRTIMQRLLAVRVAGDSVDSWLSKVREEEARLGTLLCPEPLLCLVFSMARIQ
jgi:hypothetical protein